MIPRDGFDRVGGDLIGRHFIYHAHHSQDGDRPFRHQLQPVLLRQNCRDAGAPDRTQVTAMYAITIQNVAGHFASDARISEGHQDAPLLDRRIGGGPDAWKVAVARTSGQLQQERQNQDAQTEVHGAAGGPVAGSANNTPGWRRR